MQELGWKECMICLFVAIAVVKLMCCVWRYIKEKNLRRNMLGS